MDLLNISRPWDCQAFPKSKTICYGGGGGGGGDVQTVVDVVSDTVSDNTPDIKIDTDEISTLDEIIEEVDNKTPDIKIIPEDINEVLPGTDDVETLTDAMEKVDLEPETLNDMVEHNLNNLNVGLDAVGQAAHGVGTNTLEVIDRIKEGEPIIQYEGDDGEDFVTPFIVEQIAENVTKPLLDSAEDIVNTTNVVTDTIGTNVADQLMAAVGKTPKGQSSLDGEGLEAAEGDEVGKGLRIGRRGARKGSKASEKRGGGVALKGKGSGLNIPKY